MDFEGDIKKEIKQYHLFESVIPKSVCDLVVAEADTYGLNLPESKLATFPYIHWFSGSLQQYLNEANVQTRWFFQTNYAEQLYVNAFGYPTTIIGSADPNRFIEIGTFFNDIQNSQFIRKLTALCQLNETEDMGINLEGVEGDFLTNVGDVIVIPSFVRYQPKRPKEGRNYIAQSSLMGRPFA